MRLTFTEPTSPLYIYVNPETNQVHLLMPVVSGTDIGLDNTCKSVYALQEFFGKRDGAQETILNELKKYQEALEVDLLLLVEDGEILVKRQKQERLEQIKKYITLVQQLDKWQKLDSLNGIYPDFPEPLKAMIRDHDSNLYGMRLRPRQQDFMSRIVNTVFNSAHDVIMDQGNSVVRFPSLFQETLQATYEPILLAPKDAKARLAQVVIETFGVQCGNFESLKALLSLKIKELFGVEVNFIQTITEENATREYIDAEMGFDSTTPTQAYIDALLGYCAPTLFDTLMESPFYTLNNKEALSITTQFFLATVNIYCRVHGVSSENFGKIFNKSPELCREIAACVASTITGNGNIEDELLHIINRHANELKLKRTLSPEDFTIIKKQFTERYIQIKDSDHFDEFMVLDLSKPNNLFVSHQGSICTDFCNFFARIGSSDFVRDHCRAFDNVNGTVPHKNEWISDEIEIEPEQLARLTDEQFEKLPETVKNACRVHPDFQICQFLQDVAKGKQNEAEYLLTANFANIQRFLQTPKTFTDYSGRTFHCTAYEYAYWAKDTHMCRMLESYMDDNTKAQILARIDEIERIDELTGKPIGLEYQQNGTTYRTAHFDLTPLIQALQQYKDGYENWLAASEWATMQEAWMAVGKAQYNIPAHVAQEYCRSDRAFDPIPQFNELTLPRLLEFKNFNIGRNDHWYLPVTPNSMLGVDIAVIRGTDKVYGGRRRGCGDPHVVNLDSAALGQLDEQRNRDLQILHTRLSESPLPDTDQAMQKITTEIQGIHSIPQLLILFNAVKSRYGRFAALHQDQPNAFRLFFKKQPSNATDGKFWHTTVYQQAVGMLKEKYLELKQRAPLKVIPGEEELVDYVRGNASAHHSQTGTRKKLDSMRREANHTVTDIVLSGFFEYGLAHWVDRTPNATLSVCGASSIYPDDATTISQIKAKLMQDELGKHIWLVIPIRKRNSMASYSSKVLFIHREKDEVIVEIVSIRQMQKIVADGPALDIEPKDSAGGFALR